MCVCVCVCVCVDYSINKGNLFWKEPKGILFQIFLLCLELFYRKSYFDLTKTKVIQNGGKLKRVLYIELRSVVNFLVTEKYKK